LAALAAADVHAVAHITGGGLPGNLQRVLPPDLDAVLDRSAWDEPRVFGEIRRAGPVTEGEMLRVFNLGLGMVVAAGPGDVDAAVRALGAAGQDARVVGRLAAGAGRVSFVGRPAPA
ncbi:MAG: AIR synthase-related protein, partial [Acidimicrobiales bacterium]